MAEEEREMVVMVTIGEGGEGESREACVEKKESDGAETVRREVREALVVEIVVLGSGVEGDGATGVIGGEEETEKRVGAEEVKRSAAEEKEVDATAQHGEAEGSGRSTITDSDDVEEKKRRGDGAVVGIGETDREIVAERDRRGGRAPGAEVKGVEGLQRTGDEGEATKGGKEADGGGDLRNKQEGGARVFGSLGKKEVTASKTKRSGGCRDGDRDRRSSRRRDKSRWYKTRRRR